MHLDAEATIDTGASCPVAWRPLIEARSDQLSPVRFALAGPAQSASGAEAASTAGTRYGLIVVLAGLGVVLAAFAVSVAVFHTKDGDVSTVLAPVTGVIGTVVGAYFGVQVGSQGKEQADANAASAHDKAMRFAAVSDPDRAAAALGFRRS